jgi:hypothetical protein
MQEREEEKGESRRERVAGKAAGDDCVFIPTGGPGWQMWLAPAPYRDTPGAVGRFTGRLNHMA